MDLEVEQAVETADRLAHAESMSTRRPRPRRDGRWSESALRVLRERYLIKRDGKVVETPDEMCWRVACAIAAAENRWETQSAVEEYEAAFYDLLIDRKFMPNSPTLMNAGTGNGLQFSACFVLPVGDSINDI
ncbi:MAG TPA: ribonucleotide reductase N-terminal alpha domain-containing protein, partial [Chloroflexota bacterium]